MVSTLWRPGGLVINVLALRYRDQGGSPLRARPFRCTSIWLTLEITYFCVGHYVVFLNKTLSPRSASLYPGVQMGSGEFHAGDSPGMA